MQKQQPIDWRQICRDYRAVLRAGLVPAMLAELKRVREAAERADPNNSASLRRTLGFVYFGCRHPYDEAMSQWRAEREEQADEIASGVAKLFDVNWSDRRAVHVAARDVINEDPAPGILARWAAIARTGKVQPASRLERRRA